MKHWIMLQFDRLVNERMVTPVSHRIGADSISVGVGSCPGIGSGSHPTRFRPGQSGNPAGRRKGIGVDIFEARHIAARTYRDAFYGRPLQERAAAIAAEIEAGARDDGPEVRSVLAAIRRGRVLGRRAK